MIEDEIIEEIRQAWVAVATGRNNLEVAVAVPDFRDLKALLELAFLASTKLEEGQSIKLRLVFFPGATVESLQQRAGWLDALAFEQPLASTVHNLRKLCPAFNQLTTALVVGGENGQYYLIGAVHYGRPLSWLDEATSGRGRPNALTLSSRNPGSVAVGHADGVIGRFENGIFTIAKADALASRRLVPHILSVISEHPAYRQFQMQYWYLYRSCLQRIYMSAVNIGHGGTIIWVPSELKSSVGGYSRSGFSLTTRSSGSDFATLALRASIPSSSPRSVGTEKKDLTDYVDMIARLSCVDGAVLIDDYLRPLRFAVHLASEQWQGDVLEGPLREMNPGDSIDTSNFGTRHRSAINFVAANPGTIGFVVSEDGPVRAVSRFDNAVLIWPDCSNTVFMDN